jgi:hypothetical protein
LWVALLEKAYAQANSEGFLASNSPLYNSYQALNGISSTTFPDPSGGVIQAITDHAATSTNEYAIPLANAWTSREMVLVSTNGLPTNATSALSLHGVNIVSSHVYAVVGYNATTQQYVLYNPWGVNGSYEALPNNQSTYCSGLVTATQGQLASTSSSSVQTTNGPQQVVIWNNLITAAGSGTDVQQEVALPHGIAPAPADRMTPLGAVFSAIDSEWRNRWTPQESAQSSNELIDRRLFTLDEPLWFNMS